MDFASLTPLDGGWSGETFLGRAGEERCVVRIFAAKHHAPHAAEIQAALLRLVRGLVPVPAVLEVSPARDGMPAMLVTEHIEGVRGDVLLPTLDPERRHQAGHRLGRVAATFAGMPMRERGRFVDPDLHIDPWRLDLAEWSDAHPCEEIDPGRLRMLADRAQDLLDTVTRASLAHSDLNPKNVLLDPVTLEVRAVLDFEFAHAGHPFTDLGNLLRFERDQPWTEGVLAGWTEIRGGSPARALDLARAADLVALIELASRREENPVAAAAYDLLRTTVASTLDA